MASYRLPHRQHSVATRPHDDARALAVSRPNVEALDVPDEATTHYAAILADDTRLCVSNGVTRLFIAANKKRTGASRSNQATAWCLLRERRRPELESLRQVHAPVTFRL